jgi:hypothetical protein
LPEGVRLANGSRGAMPTRHCRWLTSRVRWGEQISSCWQRRPICSAMRTNAGRLCSAPTVHHIAAGDVRRAARCLFWVAFTLLLEGSLAVAGGWLAKAGRMLDQEPRECAELGLLLLPSVVQASIEGDYARAEAAAAWAAEIGARFGDADCLRSGCISRVALC